jgi:hypothetical protein
VIALVAGLLVRSDTDSEAFSVSVPAAIAAGVLLGGFVLFAASKGWLRARSARGAGDPDDRIDAGENVQVRSVEGLTLDVAREKKSGGSKGADSE